MRLMAWMLFASVFVAAPAAAQPPRTNYANLLKEGDAVLHDFRFADGERLLEVRIH